ncbi:MAG TPA: mechanosensitive ion channel domain-containing protein [Afifellaceae bacterium]|nr:mechanosensitive ion channel domain-containing protein [Afifellaceae bacterium]
MDDSFKVAFATVIEQASAILVEYSFSVLGAIALLIIGFIAAGVISRAAERNLARLKGVDKTLSTFLSNMIRYAILVLVVVTVLAQFGVQTTSIIAALGAIGLAIGLALQGTLANIASGIMLLVLRPFRVGEYIDAGGISGTVMEVGLFTTELKQADGLFVMAPNGQLWNKSIVNYTRHPIRRFELIVGIGYDDDMAEAKKILLDMAGNHDNVLENPAPVTYVNSLDDSSVGIGMRVWINTADFLATSWDIIETAKKRFDSAGISIPYPQRDIHQK